MLSLETIRRALQHLVLKAVEAETGITSQTLRNIRDGKNAPQKATQRVLSDYLKGLGNE